VNDGDFSLGNSEIIHEIGTGIPGYSDDVRGFSEGLRDYFSPVELRERRSHIGGILIHCDIMGCSHAMAGIKEGERKSRGMKHAGAVAAEVCQNPCLFPAKALHNGPDGLVRVPAGEDEVFSQTLFQCLRQMLGIHSHPRGDTAYGCLVIQQYFHLAREEEKKNKRGVRGWDEKGVNGEPESV